MGAEPAPALSGIGPPRRDLRRRIGEGRHLQQVEAEEGLADRALGDGPSQRRLARGEAPLGPEQVHDSGRLGGGEHGSGLGEVPGKRLLAHDVPAGPDRLKDDRTVRMRRGGDGHHVHPRHGQGGGERGGGLGNTEQGGTLGGLVLVTPDEGLDVDPGLLQCPDVGEHAETGPHDGCAETAIGAHGSGVATRTGIRRSVLAWYSS